MAFAVFLRRNRRVVGMSAVDCITAAPIVVVGIVIHESLSAAGGKIQERIPVAFQIGRKFQRLPFRRGSACVSGHYETCMEIVLHEHCDCFYGTEDIAGVSLPLFAPGSVAVIARKEDVAVFRGDDIGKIPERRRFEPRFPCHAGIADEDRGTVRIHGGLFPDREKNTGCRLKFLLKTLRGSQQMRLRSGVVILIRQDNLERRLAVFQHCHRRFRNLLRSASRHDHQNQAKPNKNLLHA